MQLQKNEGWGQHSPCSLQLDTDSEKIMISHILLAKKKTLSLTRLIKPQAGFSQHQLLRQGLAKALVMPWVGNAAVLLSHTKEQVAFFPCLHHCSWKAQQPSVTMAGEPNRAQ